MPPVPPKKKPARKLTPGHHLRPIEQETAGKIYLVRDKDYGDGKPVMWARDVAYEQAFKLKETLAARRLSTTVRFEEQAPGSPYLTLPIDPRSPYQQFMPPHVALTATPAVPLVDPQLAGIQAGALGAAAGAAAEANRRHAELKARKEAEAKVAAMTPPPMPEIPTDEEIAAMSPEDLAKLGIDPDELEKLMSAEMPGDDEIAAAAAEVAESGTLRGEPFNALEQAMRWPCTHVDAKGVHCGAMPGIACTDPSGPITHRERIEAALAAGDPRPEAEHG